MNDLNAYLINLLRENGMSDHMITEDRLQEMGEVLYEKILVNVAAHLPTEAKEGFAELMEQEPTNDEALISYAKKYITNVDEIVVAVLEQFTEEYKNEEM